ncbi:flavin reductase family protein [Agromyces intestinalis]|uniref:Flavin reductase family protein n=1 Tax=Agromyces intestinalis TaxID=2592652 RepID=A0A5C1YH56_9MICO|nr:flavin reductase family protein [Agromyces intestinalis]QEO14429.1 flavin reductase family protein [Agromyces intestinalis]
MPEPDDHLVIEPSVLYVGTPVYLVSTMNPDGTPNLAPASSHFALGRTIVLGLETDGQSVQNLADRPELTVSFPSGALWRNVERLSTVTGRDPVPDAKADHYRFEPEKFERAGLSPVASDLVAPPRVRECPLQFEAVVQRITPGVDAGFAMVESEVVRVHAHPALVVPGTDHLDPRAWHPLIYSFRHYFDRGSELGWTRKSRTAPTPPEIARWESFGGTWEVADVGDSSATVRLCRCDGGEEVSRITSSEPDFVAWAAVMAS